MGIHIHLAVSKSITRDEWEKVYQETLWLVDKFPLAEKRQIDIKGIKTICLVPTREREFVYGWPRERVHVGWQTVGDYEYMCTGEDYFLPKDLVDTQEIESDAGDAIYGAIPAYRDCDREAPKYNRVHEVWGAKTQGEPYHMYLLAIACLVENRLKEKAFVYGDITKGQCVKAVDIANKYLPNKIEVPDRCDMKKLFLRVSQLNLSGEEKLDVFETMYLGNKEEEFGNFIRKNFTSEVWNLYWANRFSDVIIGTVGFDNLFQKYMLWGGDLRKLCDFVKYIDREGNTLYEKFIVRVLDAKLHLKDKDCRDFLKIDQNEAAPYGVATLFAQFAFAGARNRKVDRYIPIDELRAVLEDTFSSKCDVNKIIDDYLEEEQKENSIDRSASKEEFEKACRKDVSNVFEDVMEHGRQKYQEEREKYDIYDYEDLMFYEKGDSMRPAMKEALRDSYLFYQSMTQEKSFAELMNKKAKERCEWLIKQNQYVLIRDTDWEKIFTDIEEHEESFERYYPMVRVLLDSDGLVNMVRAITLNDELYEYCKELALRCSENI